MSNAQSPPWVYPPTIFTEAMDSEHPGACERDEELPRNRHVASPIYAPTQNLLEQHGRYHSQQIQGTTPNHHSNHSWSDPYGIPDILSGLGNPLDVVAGDQDTHQQIDPCDQGGVLSQYMVGPSVSPYAPSWSTMNLRVHNQPAGAPDNSVQDIPARRQQFTPAATNTTSSLKFTSEPRDSTPNSPLNQPMMGRTPTVPDVHTNTYIHPHSRESGWNSMHPEPSLPPSRGFQSGSRSFGPKEVQASDIGQASINSSMGDLCLASGGFRTPGLGQPPPSPSPSRSDPFLPCPRPNCEARFHGRYRKGNLARHKKNQHGGHQGAAMEFHCEDEACTRAFRRKDARLKHYKKHHPGRAARSRSSRQPAS